MSCAITLESPPPLAVRIALASYPGSAEAAAALLANTTHATTRVIPALVGRGKDLSTGQVRAAYSDPLEVLVAAGMVEGAQVRGASVSALAAELLRDVAEPTASARAWLLDRLGVEAVPEGAFVAARGAPVVVPERFDPPHIALRFPVRDGSAWRHEVRVFADTTVTIGRRIRDLQIEIDDASISRRQCQLSVRDGEWTIADSGSTHGVRFRGEPVDSILAATGDVYRLGDHDVEVVAIV